MIDDDPFIREAARAVLEAAGYDATCAPDGVEGVKACAESGAGFALAVVDREMPYLDGPSAAKSLRALDPALRVLGMADGSHGGDAGFARAGVRAVLRKPFGGSELLRAVRAELDRDRS